MKQKINLIRKQQISNENESALVKEICENLNRYNDLKDSKQMYYNYLSYIRNANALNIDYNIMANNLIREIFEN